MPALSTILWVAAGVLMGYLIWRVGNAVNRSMATPPPEPPPPGELRKVNVRYRCTVCAMEIKMTMAPDEDPAPPRHCMEDMEIVAPLYE